VGPPGELLLECLAPAVIQDWFGEVLATVVIVGTVIALITFLGLGRAYDQIGRGGLSIDEEKGRGAPLPAAGAGAMSAGTAAERDAEIRQLLEARNERRRRRGEDPLDIDDELRRLTAPSIDPALREEIRQLVVARNERRMRRGQEPLDVEAEIERQVRELG
jgi:hypothetical protein